MRRVTGEVLETSGPSDPRRAEVHDLCIRSYDEDLTDLLPTFPAATHVLLRVDGVTVSHAMWVDRGLRLGDGSELRTAYIEIVATDPAHRLRGYATKVMARAAAEIAASSYDLAALSTGTPAVYTPLGWRPWHGPLSIRMPDGSVLPTPEEEIMVLDLPGRPRVDETLPVSAEWREGEVW